jgi:hypothetical protein
MSARYPLKTIICFLGLSLLMKDYFIRLWLREIDTQTNKQTYKKTDEVRQTNRQTNVQTAIQKTDL